MYRSWHTRTALLAWSMLSFCFRSSRSMPLTLSSLRTKSCSWSLHLTISRTKSVADCQNFWIRSLAFSSVQVLRGLPLPGRLLTVPVYHSFLNSLLTPHFVQLFSGNSSVNLFAVYPFKYELFVNILSSSLNAMLTNTAVTSAVMNFWCHKLIAKVKVKEQWHGKFYLQSVWRKIRYFKHWKYQNLWMNNKVRGD